MRDTMRTETATQERAAHAPGCVLWIDEKAWESGSEVRASQAPIPVEAWIAATRRKGYQVAWTPEGAIVEGPYADGAVVEVDSDAAGDAGRTYFAVPAEILDRLQELMPARDYQMVREDVANIDNPEGRGYSVTRIDATAWEQRRQVVPTAAPIGTETWAAFIRAHHMRVAPPAGNALSLDSLYPAGQVVAVDDAAGRSYFAAPRAAYWLAYELADESGGDAPHPAIEGEETGAETADASEHPPEVFHSVGVQWLDTEAWERRRQLVPLQAPVSVAVWAGTIRAYQMGVELPPDGLLPDDSLYPGGRVAIVDDAGGRRYFAVPRPALDVAHDLAREHEGAPGTAGRA